jgi:3-(3-hydroxy-phenyl)propionate hydroxylase
VLGPGAFDPEAGGLAGCPFPQPRLKDGRLLEELLGRRCAVIGRQQPLSAAVASTAEHWKCDDAVVIDQPDPAVEQWLESHQISAVVLRPDRYIVGVSCTASDLDRISQYLPVAP